MWDWIGNNPLAAANIFFAATVATSAAASAWLNRTLVVETKLLRMVETDPLIAVYMEKRRDDPIFFDLVIRNVGRGSGYDITFALAPGRDRNRIDEEWKAELDVVLFSEGLSYMAPGQEIRSYLDSLPDLPREPVRVVVTFFGAPGSESRRRAFRQAYTLDKRQFEGVATRG